MKVAIQVVPLEVIEEVLKSRNAVCKSSCGISLTQHSKVLSDQSHGQMPQGHDFEDQLLKPPVVPVLYRESKILDPPPEALAEVKVARSQLSIGELGFQS